MTTKIEVTVNVSPDGFLGYDPDAIAKIDQDASRSIYCDAVRKEVSKCYPELDLTFEFRDATHAYEGDIEDNVRAGLTDIESEIYDAGMFWVDK